MLTNRVIGRFLGDRPSMVRPGQLPTLAVQNLQDMRFPGVWVSAPVMGVSNPKAQYSGAVGILTWDPPVAGFPAGEIMAQLPVNGPDLVTIIVSNPVASAFNPFVGFAPGVYDISVDYLFAPTANLSTGVKWVFCGSNDGVLAVTNQLGPGIPPFNLRMMAFGAAQPRQLPTFRLVAEGRWSAVLMSETAVADTSTGTTFIAVIPRALFDDAGNVF